MLLLFGLALLSTLWRAGGIDSTAARFQCDVDERERWRVIRDHVDFLLPRFSGRLNFVLLRGDLAALEAIQKEVDQLELPGELLQAHAPVPDWSKDGWTECHSALLAVRGMFLVVQVSGTAQASPHLAAALATSVLAAPWLDVLLSGWQVFTIMATLARWTSPHQDVKSAQASGSHGRAALKAASLLTRSQCDAAESGAMLAARQMLGKLWRHRDPGLCETDVEGTRARELEEALAGLKNSAGDARSERGQCRWTEHPGRYLGGLVKTSEELRSLYDKDIETDEEKVSISIKAMSVCNSISECVGITYGPSPSTELQRLSLRLGEPMLAISPSGESSFVQWCTPAPSFEDVQVLCPLGKVVGLLGTAFRRLGDGGSMSHFAPELVIEAQEELTSFLVHLGPIAGQESWKSQWPTWQVLGRLQQRLELLRHPAFREHGLPAWLRPVQRAVGFDDEAMKLAVAELESLTSKAVMPSAVRESVRCLSGQSCVAELFGRMQVMLFDSEYFPLRDPIFVYNEDSLLPEMQLRSSNGQQGDPDMDYDWLKLLREEKRRNDKESGGDAEDRAAQIRDMMPLAHPLQVDRMQLAHFILEVKDEVVAGGYMRRCLEWDQPFLLVRAFSLHCRWMDVYSYSEPSPKDPRLGLPGRQEYGAGTIHYWGDMEVEENFGVEPESMDLVLCPFVFEHVSKPWDAIRTLAKTLRPGGYVIWSAPMFQQYHGSPHDYYRYTPKGVKALAAHAGLEVVRLYAPGDLSLMAGVNMGMMLPYWRTDQVLNETEPVYPEDSPRHPLNVFALLRKPGDRPPVDETYA